MAVRAVNTCFLFRSSSPPLRFSSSSCRHHHRSTLRRSPAFLPPPPLFSDYGCRLQRRSVHSLFDSVMEELRAMRKRRTKRVSAASK